VAIALKIAHAIVLVPVSVAGQRAYVSAHVLVVVVKMHARALVNQCVAAAEHQHIVNALVLIVIENIGIVYAVFVKSVMYIGINVDVFVTLATGIFRIVDVVAMAAMNL
jgi:hypothetical protein